MKSNHIIKFHNVVFVQIKMIYYMTWYMSGARFNYFPASNYCGLNVIQFIKAGKLKLFSSN